MDHIFGLQYRSVAKCFPSNQFLMSQRLKYYSSRFFESAKIKRSVELLKNVCVPVRKLLFVCFISDNIFLSYSRNTNYSYAKCDRRLKSKRKSSARSRIYLVKLKIWKTSSIDWMRRRMPKNLRSTDDVLK